MSPRRVIYTIAAILIGLGIVGAYFALRSDLARKHLLTTEAVATIENVDARSDIDPVSGAEKIVDVSVQYRYSVNGVEYRRTTKMSRLSAGQFVNGRTAKVCYKAEDLKTIEAGELFPASDKCGDW